MRTEQIRETLQQHNIELQYVLTERFVDTIRREFGDKEPEVILDIGSRDLDQSIELRCAFPNARIIAFEPNPNQYKLCSERAKLFEVDFIGCAVSDVEGTSDFWVLDFNEGGSSLLKPVNVPWSSNVSNKVPVPCRRIDTILKELGVSKVDCVWMDVQGYELKALQSFGSYLKDVRVMHTEASPNPNYEGHVSITELEKFLVDNDFELDFRPARFHPFGEGDIICIKKGPYSRFTSLSEKVYNAAKKKLHVTSPNVLVVGECADRNYLKRYFENANIYQIRGMDFGNEQQIDERLEAFGVYFDVILDVSTGTDYWNQVRLVRNCVRHLAPGGVLILETISYDNMQRYAYDIWEYRHDEYFLEANFEGDSMVLIRNNLKYGKYWGKSRNSFVVKESY